MKRILLTLSATLLLMLLVRTCAFTSCTIPSAGMENSLYRGDRVIVNKWSYGLRMPFVSLWGYHRWLPSSVEYGDIVLFNNPAPTNDKESIDGREVYISRCMGEPGDTLMLNSKLDITGDFVVNPDDKYLYAYPGEKEDVIQKAMNRLGITDNFLLGYDEGNYIRSFSHFELYLLKQHLEGTIEFKALQTDTTEGVHPFVIPSKGKAIRIYPWNAKLLCNTINRHEKRNAQLKGDSLLIDGKFVQTYTFQKDYCWMASANSINVYDSRLFGLVPEDHLIGRASFIWFSKDTTAPWYKGYRWDRFFIKL
ncbi:MAG: signal peptidase I [Bacteroidaceae bacterium]|nr:signal peptidase I [Bacteroidaceae bacterium]